jgi:hypothetical protein
MAFVLITKIYFFYDEQAAPPRCPHSLCGTRTTTTTHLTVTGTRSVAGVSPQSSSTLVTLRHAPPLLTSTITKPNEDSDTRPCEMITQFSLFECMRLL